MTMHRVVTLVAVALLAVSFCASRLLAAEMAGVMMKDGKMMMMKDGKATGPMEHEHPHTPDSHHDHGHR